MNFIQPWMTLDTENLLRNWKKILLNNFVLRDLIAYVLLRFVISLPLIPVVISIASVELIYIGLKYIRSGSEEFTMEISDTKYSLLQMPIESSVYLLEEENSSFEIILDDEGIKVIKQ